MADTVLIPEYIRAMDQSLNIRTSGMSSDPLEDNMVDHYIDHLFDLCEIHEFEDSDRPIFNKDPKRLSHHLWGTTDYYFIIMIMNDFDHYEDMDLTKIDRIYVPGVSRMTFMKKLLDRKVNNNLVLMDYE